MTNLLKRPVLAAVFAAVTLAAQLGMPQSANAIAIGRCVQVHKDPQVNRDTLFNRCQDCRIAKVERTRPRSEEHTSELQSHHDLVCRLLLEKKKKEKEKEKKKKKN